MRGFSDYAAAGFADDLLPILPHDADVDPESPSFDGLIEKRGKVPGKKVRGRWFGFKGWTGYTADPNDFPIWQEWGAGIGMQGRIFPALDIDIDEPELADDVHELATSILGHAPCRFGNGSRRALVFAGPGLAKRRLAFCPASNPAVATVDGSFPEAGGLDAPEPQAVEFLAEGQHYVVEGIHPKTRQPYYWRDGQSPVDVGPANLVVIGAEQLDQFYDRLEGLLVAHGYTIVNRYAGKAGGGRVDQESLRAPDFDAVRRAMAALPNEVDYDGWIKVGAALRASAGPEHDAEAYELFMDWSLLWPENTPEAVEAKWASLTSPYKVGWDYLSRFATEFGDGSFSAAQEDFEAVGPAPTPEEIAAREAADPLTALFRRSVWVQRLKRVCDLETGELFDREQFNVGNNHIGDPSSPKECAWATLLRDTNRLQRVMAVTYRPGADVFVQENLPGLVGRCINRWRDPCPNLPESASDDDVKPWLDHVRVVVPEEREQGIVLDWLAWTVQNPGEKPNWCLVVGSTAEGMGKDLMMEPVRVALGPANVREIGPEDLNSSFTDYLANTRLLIVEEMQLSERKAMQNKLKPLIAAPPHTLRVNVKFEPQYEVPNTVALVFFTNMDDALAMSRQDRRYFVVWNGGQPRAPDYYRGLVEWYESGGAALAARWLQQRDVSTFNAKGVAPMTAAKMEMRKASLPEADALIVNALQYRDPPFHRRFVLLTEALHLLNGDNDGPSRIRENSAGRKLRAAGLHHVRRASLGRPPAHVTVLPRGYNQKQMQLFVMPGDVAALDLLNDNDALKEAFWSDWTAGLEQTEQEEAYDRLFS